MMVEAGGTERSWEYYEDGAPKVTEEVLADGPRGGQDLDPRVDQPPARAGGRAWWPRRAPSSPSRSPPSRDYGDDVFARVEAVGTDADRPRPTPSPTRPSRNEATDKATAEIMAELAGRVRGPRARDQGGRALAHQEAGAGRASSSEGVRIDGRGTADIRPLSAEVDLFPTAHGSALFQRGETQVLNVTTLGMPRMDQMLDTISPDESKRYMHHYNFPPFSTGETGFMRGPKRREIGHGLLAERALLPVVPPKEEFPYALRLVSDVLASNGSTSMASVCGSTLSLMAAGVPIKAPVAGIAMGLVYDGGQYVTLTDILGAEDAFGDMDFKVAGTADAVTALQLDTKIDGLPADVLAQALLQAKEARLKILEVMRGAIAEPRDRGGGQRPQDRLDGDPDRQDRRGHRAQGQGHQHPAAGDRGRHRRRRRRHGGHGHHRGQGRQRRSRRPAAGSPSSWTRRRPTWARSTRARWSTSPSSGPSSTCCPAATACCTSPSSPPWPAASGSTRWRTSSPWARPSRSGWTTSTRRARCRCRWPTRPRAPEATAAPATAASGPSASGAARARRASTGASRGRRARPGGRRPAGGLLRGRLRGRAGGRPGRPRSRAPSAGEDGEATAAATGGPAAAPRRR